MAIALTYVHMGKVSAINVYYDARKSVEEALRDAGVAVEAKGLVKCSREVQELFPNEVYARIYVTHSQHGRNRAMFAGPLSTGVMPEWMKEPPAWMKEIKW